MLLLLGLCRLQGYCYETGKKNFANGSSNVNGDKAEVYVSSCVEPIGSVDSSNDGTDQPSSSHTSVYANVVHSDHVKNKYGLQKVMMNNGVFFFKYASTSGLEDMLENEPYMIWNVPILLEKWSPNVSLAKEELTKTRKCGNWKSQGKRQGSNKSTNGSYRPVVKPTSGTLVSNPFSATEEDNGNYIDDLVDEKRNNVKASPRMTVAKVIQEQLAEHFSEDGFEFSFEEVSHKDMDSKSWQVYPVFNRDLGDEVKSKDEKIDVSVSITSQLRKLFVDEEFVSSSYSSSESEEADSDNELENIPSGTFCLWRPKAESGSSSPSMTKCKKSSSTGSGSKRWSIRYLLKRSNSEGKQQPMVSLISKQKRSSGEVPKDVARLKGKTPAHEMFYVQRRAEKEIVNRKSFLPYRQNLVGLFGNVNGMGKMLPF
uniref:Uncharacterized protein n=1 Tax=Tanacetum cinerariifolium TaxID=118510 RepID=A0A6L2LBF8_TANCI|nr:hypothetical protein [Tanacetum cinerariifolium]